MKYKAIPILLLLLFQVFAFGQNSQAFKYQAVARDAAGYPITNADISIQIIITSENTDDYSEAHFVTTNSFGLINIEVGNGEMSQGSFEDIDWGYGEHFIEVSIDPQGGNNWVVMGSSQILSVPMASYAAVAGNVVDTSLINELQKIELEGNILSLELDGGSVNLSHFDNSQEILELIAKISADSIYFETNFQNIDEAIALLDLDIIEEMNRAIGAETALAELISENTIQIINDSSYFQDLFDNISFESDSIYFQALIDNNTNKIISDSIYLKLLIDANQFAIQQEITRAILSEAINNSNIIINAEAIANIQTSYEGDSLFFKQLIDANTNSILGEITRAISAELLNSNNISVNAQEILINQLNIFEDSTSFQNQINAIDFALQDEITRAIYRDAVNSDSIQILYNKNIVDSTHFQNQINGLAGGGLDPSLENGKIFIGNSNNIATGVNLSGDAQVTNTGVMILNPSSIITNKIADANVTNEKLENSAFTISDDHGNSGEIELGEQLQINGAGATNLFFNPLTKTLDITSSDNQYLSLNGNSLTISSGNTLDISSIVGQEGPMGPQGPQGEVGETGPQGMTGATGAAGPQGEIGETGSQGSQGITGLTGAVGPTGPQGEIGETGPQGSQGITGLTGAVGPAGPQGEIGETGPQGSQGITGLTGAVGPTGPQGEIGETGPQGSQGITGLTGAVGPTGPQGEIGETGPQGSQGITGLTGAVGPTGPQGEIGETGPQGSQGITGLTGAVGPTGPQGEIGETGPQGSQGITGLTGAVGPTGPQGVVGETGAQGPQGITGLTGAVGPTGPQGEVGETGAQGPQGITGLTGAVGPTGPQGEVGVTGAQGPQGITGLTGAIGPAGPQGEVGATGPTGSSGADGASITWKGLLIADPPNPNVNDAYYNPVSKASFIYNGSTWNIMTIDGLTGPQGPTGPIGPAGTSLRDCPAGDWSAINEQFCIEVNENSADTWWNASKFCGDQNSHLCTWDEWYYTCQKSGSGTINMTNDWEWTNTGQPGAIPSATVIGSGSCLDSSTELMSITNSFRCCFTR